MFGIKCCISGVLTISCTVLVHVSLVANIVHFMPSTNDVLPASTQVFSGNSIGNPALDLGTSVNVLFASI